MPVGTRFFHLHPRPSSQLASAGDAKLLHIGLARIYFEPCDSTMLIKKCSLSVYISVTN
jgi:hypothetical protein